MNLVAFKVGAVELKSAKCSVSHPSRLLNHVPINAASNKRKLMTASTCAVSELHVGINTVRQNSGVDETACADVSHPEVLGFNLI